MTIRHHQKHAVTAVRTYNAIFMAIKLMEAYYAGNVWKEDSKMKFDYRKYHVKLDSIELKFDELKSRAKIVTSELLTKNLYFISLE